MANTLAAVIIQDLTYTSKMFGRSILVSYLNGGVAGAETVTVTDQVGATPAHIRVTIASGTSTALQIKTAVDAYRPAAALVTVTVSGTGSNTQKTCVSASLSGGVAAAKATLTVQGTMKLTAEATGTSGNSTSFKLLGDLPINITAITDADTLAITSNTNVCVGSTIIQGANEAVVTVINSATSIDVDSTTGFTTGAAVASVAAGSEAVRVNTAAIIVQVEDGVSTYEMVKDAIEGFGAAAALVDVSFFGPTSDTLVRVASMASAVNLSGGLAAANAAVVVQDITFSADAPGTANNGRTITYTTGATAGSEVVSGTDDISVQIQNATSTATQIKTALDAYPAFNGVAASGTITVDQWEDMNAASATATITVVDYSALTGAVLTVNGTALTEGAEWTAAVDNATTAASLELAVEAVTGISSTALSNVITATVVTPGTAGNAFTLATSDAVNLTISGALFSGGLNNATFTVGATTLTAGTGFTAASTDGATATSIASAIHALSGVHASALSTVVTVVADAVDSTGNSIVFSGTGEGSTLDPDSGFLEGGVDGLAATITGTAGNAQKTVNSAPLASEDVNSTKDFYMDQGTAALTGSFVAYPFNFHANTIAIYNDETAGAEYIEWSFEGSTVGGRLLPTESIILDRNQSGFAVISLRGDSDLYRVYAVGK